MSLNINKCMCHLQSSFVSPNRTCYLSPTALAMSLGFLKSPDRTRPKLDISDLEIEENINLEIEGRVEDHIKEDDVEKSVVIQPEAASDNASDCARHDEEETIEAIQVTFSN